MKQIAIRSVVVMMALAAWLPAASYGQDAVAPFINAKTDLVVHADLSKIDMDAVNTWWQKSLDSSGVEKTKLDQMKLDAQQRMADAKEWTGKFTKAGGKDVYIVVQFAGLLTGEPGAVIVPLGEGADADALAKIFNPNPPAADADPQNAAPTTAVIGKTLVFAPGTMIGTLKTATGAPRQDLTDALAVGADSPVHVAIAASGLTAATAMASAPGMRGITRNPAFAGVTWTGLAVAPPPSGSAKVTMQCKDGDAASAVVTAINGRLDQMKQNPEVQQSMGDKLDQFVSALTPSAEGTKVNISLTQSALDTVLPGIINARSKAPVRRPAPAMPNPAGGAPNRPPEN